jgi:urease accessory protein
MIPGARVPSTVLLSLADQRLPSGGHVHSGGVEEGIATGRIVDDSTLEGYLLERLQTVGLVAASLAAAAATANAESLPALDAEADARMPSPVSRALSRSQGRGLMRIATAAWAAPSTELAWTDLGARPHHALMMGSCAQAAGLEPGDAALVVAYQCVTGAATAGQRLLGLDPISVAVLTIAMGSVIDVIAAAATEAAKGSYRDLPDIASYALDLNTEGHAVRENRLFAS